MTGSPFMQQVRTDLRTTEIYTHVIGNRRAGTKSPVDFIV